MPAPKIFQTRQLVLPQVSARAIAPPAGGSVSSRQLGFTMEQQQQTNWCWAAVSTSVSHYYQATSSWHQCSLANHELGQTSCCQDGSSSACDQPHYLERGLSAVRHDGGNSSGPLSFSQVRSEIDAGRPVGCFIRWGSQAVGHFVVIEGYRQQGGIIRLNIEDSYYGASDYDFDDFRDRYQNAGGSWQWTYFTR
jgi:hypothetical protein